VCVCVRVCVCVCVCECVCGCVHASLCVRVHFSCKVAINVEDAKVLLGGQGIAYPRLVYLEHLYFLNPAKINSRLCED